ncbi:MAG: helix-turn-helix transcriptional regulator [Lamprobacter sp.]|uniref:helix-turn-helix domain-containing protein n=1 Tax=Lamprobacter sp. TaxID=3100796 RepID=UPI002B26079A|nr:helix-turn-helix transcriptional regulator [Lamprobacter sp.]MEA3640869.1 helix-turn-helix transcriptional regulator [Lamprobacter sp.]
MCSNQETIVGRLKAAREAAGLSQRALSTMTGLQQGQLSKIESGLVDPRLSSVLEMARALELEPVLVPRRSLLAVRALLGLDADAGRPAYRLDDDDDDAEDAGDA